MMSKEIKQESFLSEKTISRRRSCTLVITHQCNLNCVYCYESYKSDKSMPIEIMKRVIENEFAFVAQSEQFDELAIDFMGGEPLIRFDLIREIAEWIWSVPRPVPFILFSTTNGTLLNNNMKQWFRLHKQQYYLSLSLDGTPVMHKANRGNNMEKIDLDFFRENWADQPVKMTISCDTINSLAEGIIYLQESGFKVGASLGQGMPWDNESVMEFGRQLRQLAKYYIDHEEIKPTTLLDLPLREVLCSGTGKQKKYCGTGTHMATYDVDGKVYPCHLFTPLVLNNLKDEELAAIKFCDSATINDPRCSDCILKNICPTCYGFNYKLTGNVAFRDQLMCRLFKVQAMANCWFQTQLIRRKSRDEHLSFEYAAMANACLKIIKQLSEQTSNDFSSVYTSPV